MLTIERISYSGKAMKNIPYIIKLSTFIEFRKKTCVSLFSTCIVPIFNAALVSEYGSLSSEDEAEYRNTSWWRETASWCSNHAAQNWNAISSKTPIVNSYHLTKKPHSTHDWKNREKFYYRYCRHICFTASIANSYATLVFPNTPGKTWSFRFQKRRQVVMLKIARQHRFTQINSSTIAAAEHTSIKACPPLSPR